MMTNGNIQTNGTLHTNGHIPEKPPGAQTRVSYAKVNEKEEPEDEGKVHLKENITILHAIAVITTLVVGTGIYLTPQGVIANTGSVGLSLVVWLLSGIIATLGALCFAELGTTFPGSGAHYVYLEKIYGPLMAFIYLWTMVFMVRPSLNAIKALMFAKYIVQPIFGECGVDSEVVTILAVCLVGESFSIVFIFSHPLASLFPFFLFRSLK